MKKSFLILIFVGFALLLNATTIYDVQYTTTPGPDNTYPSPYDGQEVTVTGIVTAIDWKGYLDNFIISMPEGGAWKGILVYMAGDTTIVIGDEVEVTGTIDEYYGLTEISGYGNAYINVTLLSSGNPVPNPIVITTLNLSEEEAYSHPLVRLVNAIVFEAAKLGAQTEKIILSQYTVAPCLGHDDYGSFKSCVQKDDTSWILERFCGSRWSYSGNAGVLL